MIVEPKIYTLKKMKTIISMMRMKNLKMAVTILAKPKQMARIKRHT